ncbi:hypothetical protein HYT33_04135 [Candidatus Roizmanbacteria bacterium]|nr:hypothetical protein [Candidatus Roizmanbacteria bacterium]
MKERPQVIVSPIRQIVTEGGCYEVVSGDRVQVTIGGKAVWEREVHQKGWFYNVRLKRAERKAERIKRRIAART